MKNIALAVIAGLCLLVAGCADNPVGNAVTSVLTGQVTNPVTPARALALHSAFDGGILVEAAAYAKLPRCSVSPAPCSSQPIVDKLRVYVNTAESALHQLDAWALGNPNLDGPALYQAAQAAISTATDYYNANAKIGA